MSHPLRPRDASANCSPDSGYGSAVFQPSCEESLSQPLEPSPQQFGQFGLDMMASQTSPVPPHLIAIAQSHANMEHEPVPEIHISFAPLSPAMDAMEPPEINIDFAPPSRQLAFKPPIYPADIDSLSPPDRARSRNRIRCKSDPFSSASSRAQGRERAQSEPLDSIPHRDYILDLADPADVLSGNSDTKRAKPYPATFQCNLCPKRFTRAYNLRSHLRTHSDERPFVCSVCGKAFARQHDRKRHEGLHAGEKKFVCKGTLQDGNYWGCERRFARADALGRHFRSEAGRICITPLLLEEGYMVAGESAPDSRTPQEPLTAEKERSYLPAELLAQYPALAGIQWDTLPHDSDSDRLPQSELLGVESFPDNLSYGRTAMLEGIPEVEHNSSELLRGQQESGSAESGSEAQIWDSLSAKDRALGKGTPDSTDIPDIVMGEHPESHMVDHHFGLEKAQETEQVRTRGGDMYTTDSPLPPIVSDQNTTNSPLIPVPSDHAVNNPPIPPVPSDSGYHSGLGTDTESICSMDSVGSSCGLPQNFLQEFIAFFGDTLIQKAGAQEWAEYALVHRSSADIERQLNSLLKKYTMEMMSIPTNGRDPSRSKETSHLPDSSQRQVLAGAASLIRRYRPKISRYFCERATSVPQSQASFLERLQSLGRELSLNERLALLAKSGSYTHDPSENLQAEEEDDEFADLCADLRPIRELLVSNDAFNRLALELRRTLYFDDTLEMERIRLTIFEGKEGPVGDVHFNVNWMFVDFMHAQYGAELPSIQSAVVLTGSALFAQATTCGEYINRTWPKTGAFIIALLDAALHQLSRDSTKMTPLTIHRDHETYPLRVTVTAASNANLNFFIQTPDEMLVVEIAQQIAWIGSAFSASPFCEKLAYAHPLFRKTSSPSRFDIAFEHTPLHATEQACWLPLFCGAAIASGFPIPNRGNEVGLEIPLDLLAGIAGVRHAVEFEGGVVMKGFSHMFVPVRKTDNRVQWHAVTGKNPETRLSYSDALSHCKTRALSQEVSLGDLQTCRAIVGWCSVATCRLGSDLTNYENIDYSGAQDADSAIRCAGGSLGFQQFGMASLDFKFGVKEGKCHFQRSGPYQRIISIAEKTPIALYDTGERRAWLVPASSVLLHMVQHRNWLEPFEINGERIKLDTNIPAGTAKAILLKNESIRVSDSENYTFKDVVLNIWSLLEFLIDHNVSRDRNNGTSVKPTCREFVKGFEFKAVVEERSPFRQKEMSLEKKNGGWPQLVRDIDALVLLANGFEDLIVPVDQGRNEVMCRRWQRVPKGKDYLTATTKMLTELYDVAGCRLSRKYLTSTQLQWHQENPGILDSCVGADACQCNPLQQIYPKSAVGTIVPPTHIAAQGAVIFGQSGSMARGLRLKTRAQTSKASAIYSQANVQLTPIIIQPEREGSTISDDDTRARSGSDATTDSTPPSLSSCSTLSTQDTLLDMHELSTNAASPPYSRKRLRTPETPIRMSPESGDEQEPSSAFTHKRAKSEQSYIAPYLSPLQCHDRGFEDAPATRQCGSGSSMPTRNKLPANHDESHVPLQIVRDDEHIDFETGSNSSSLPLRSADEKPPRALRRRECFDWKNGVRRQIGN